MTRSVFISKEARQFDSLRDAHPDIFFLGHSFLRYKPVAFELEVIPDVVFFSSPRSVIFFSNGFDLSNATSFACVGRKTAQILTEMGTAPDFVGSHSGDVTSNVDEFSQWVGSRHVTFPLSSRSKKSYSTPLPEHQKKEVVVYETELAGRIIEPCDIYVFTSPSNVEGFLIENQVPSGAITIAWGSTTEQALMSSEITVNHTLKKSSIQELITLLKTI